MGWVSQLQQKLAETQDMLVETTIDAGNLHARIGELQDELEEARAERDGWRHEAERMRLVG